MHKSRLAWWSMVLGISGMVFSLVPLIGLCLAPLLGLTAAITGIVALVRANAPSVRIANRWQAILGLVLGILAVLFGVLVGLGILLVFRGRLVDLMDQAWNQMTPQPSTPTPTPNVP
jgi:hypothetical protein